MTIAAMSFYLFATALLAGGLLTVISRNPVHSVLWLILSFISAAGLFVLLGAEFVAMLLIIVYVGAVAVLFLFVVMMLDVDFAELKAEMAKYMPLALLIGVILLMQLGLAFGNWQMAEGAMNARAAVTPDGVQNTADPAGGDDRRDRADAAPPRRGQAAGRADADVPRPRQGDGVEGRATGAGPLTAA